MKATNYDLARARASWRSGVESAWSSIRFVELGPGPDASVLSGSQIPVRTLVDLAGLSPSDVRVEAVVGRVGTSGTLEETEVMTLPAVEQRGAAWLFQKEIVPQQTGRLGYALRICPNHDDNPLTRRCNSLIKWGVE
jgi:starch phosphorylase